MTDEQRKNTIAAYLRERKGAEARGDKAKVELIDKRLAELGSEGKPPAKRATRRA